MTPDIYEYGMVLLAGLLSAPHCIGMCGGIMSACTMQAKRDHGLIAVFSYNAGRIVTYTLIGGIMGLAGSFVHTAGSLVGLQGMAHLLGGVLILLWVFRKYTLPLVLISPTRFSVVQRLVGRLQNQNGVVPVFLCGLLFGFIPCGLTYTMQMKAAASGTLLEGALTLALFGIGTLPALVAVGFFAIGFGKMLRRRMLLVANSLAVAFGIVSIMRGLVFNGWIPSLTPWLW